MNEKMPVWPGWTTVRLIGRGSFGAVYEIERDVFGVKEKAALKVIRIPQNESEIEEMLDSGYDDASVTATFKQHLQSIVNEYSLMRQMNGAANIVNCDDFRYVQHDNGIGWDIFIRMELLTALTKAVDRVPDEMQVRRIAEDMCLALSLCRRHGIIHRDIKPQNIFLSPNGDYKLGDFGIARTMEKTSGGTKIGTYKYMAPEVYAAKPYNLTADIYSLGLVLHWLLNERRSPFLPLPPAPVDARGEEAARIRRFSGEPVPPPAHGSEGLKRIVLKACAFDPNDRYQTAEEMLADLRALGGAAGASVFRPDTNVARVLYGPPPGLDDDETVGSPVARRTQGAQPTQRPAQPVQQPAQQQTPQMSRGMPASQTEQPTQRGADVPQTPVRRNAAYPQQGGAYPQQPQQGANYSSRNTAYPQGGASYPGRGADPISSGTQNARQRQPSAPAKAPAASSGGGGKGKKGKVILFSVLGALLLVGAILAAVFLLPGSSKDGDWVCVRQIHENEKGPYSVTTFDYDADGLLVRSAYYQHERFTGYTDYECDEDGNKLEQSDRWNVTRFEYNADGLCVKSTTYSTYKGYEELSTLETWSYDSKGRENGHEYWNYEDGTAYYHYLGSYEGYKLVSYTTEDRGEVSTVRVSQTYDKNGNLTHRENFREGEIKAYYVWDGSYDKNGNLTSSSYTRTDEDGSVHSGSYTYEYMRRKDIVSAGGHTAERLVHTDDLASVNAGLPTNMLGLKDLLFAGFPDTYSSADASPDGSGSMLLSLYKEDRYDCMELLNVPQNKVYKFVFDDDVLRYVEMTASGAGAKAAANYDGSGKMTNVTVTYSDGTIATLSSEGGSMFIRNGSVDFGVYLSKSNYSSPGVYEISFNIDCPNGGDLFPHFEDGRLTYLSIYDKNFDQVAWFDFVEGSLNGYSEVNMFADVSSDFSVPGVVRVVETRMFSSAGDAVKRSSLTYYDANDNDTEEFGYYPDGSFSYHYGFIYNSEGRYQGMVLYDEDGNITD